MQFSWYIWICIFTVIWTLFIQLLKIIQITLKSYVLQCLFYSFKVYVNYDNVRIFCSQGQEDPTRNHNTHVCSWYLYICNQILLDLPMPIWPYQIGHAVLMDCLLLLLNFVMQLHDILVYLFHDSQSQLQGLWLLLILLWRRPELLDIELTKVLISLSAGVESSSILPKS